MRTCQWSGDAMITASMILLQHFPIIQVGCGKTVGPLHDEVAVRPIHVAHRHNLVRRDLIRGIEKAPHPVPRSDESNAKSVVRAKHPS